MKTIDVDFGSKTAELTMQPGKALQQADCDWAFEGSRYRVRTFEEIGRAP